MPVAARRRDRTTSPRPHHAHAARSTRTALRALVALLLASAATAVAAPSAQAFGTVWGILGQNSEHERVTRLGLQCGENVQPPECFQPASLDNLAGKRGTFGAVGAPDNIPLHLHRDRHYWHCDNADWIEDGDRRAQILGTRHYVPGGIYGQSRRAALDKLFQCVQWGRDKLFGGDTIRDPNGHPPATPDWGAVPAARELVVRGRADTANPGTGIFSPSCTFNGVNAGRPKCKVMEPFGYVLHMAEDFYSHTNWADHQDPRRELMIGNPIGLDRHELAPFLDLRIGYRDEFVPADFSGSCYPKSRCGATRVIHGESSTDLGLNKDKGLIDIRTGRVTRPGTPRGAVEFEGVTNVQRAVSMGAREAKRQWAVFREALVDRYGERQAAHQICVLTLDYAEHCDRQNVVLTVGTGRAGRAGEPGRPRAGAAAAGDDDAEVAAGQRLIDLLGPASRVAVVTFDHATGAQDVDPFTRPAAARIDDALTGDAAQDPPVDGEVERERSHEDDPTLTPVADEAGPGWTPRDGYTHGSEEGGERNDEEPHTDVARDADEGHGHAHPDDASVSAPAPPRPGSPALVPVPPATPAQADEPAAAAPAADDAGVHPAAAADALRSARRLLDAADAPRGQQGIALIADRIGSPRLLLEQLQALRADRVRVSVAVHSPRALTARVVRAIEATGGTAMVTHDDAGLKRFAQVVTGAGLTRMRDAFAHRKASLQLGAPGILGITQRGRDLHGVQTLRRDGTLLLRAFDGPLTVFVKDTGSGARRKVRVAPGRAMNVLLRAGRHYELVVAGADGRRYELELNR